MANHASHAALPYPLKGARFTVLIPFLDADGDPTAQTTPDTELSLDNAVAADAAEEVTATSGMDGMGLITFTGAETNCSTLAVAFKSASGPKTTLATLYPRVLASVGTGTLSAGSAGGGTLGTLLAYDITGCFIKTTGGTGGGGTGGANNQARKIVTYNTSTGAFTVAPGWETTPSTDTTYDILLPEGVTLGMLRALNPTTAGQTLTIESDGMAHVDVKEIEGSDATDQIRTAVGLAAANLDTQLGDLPTNAELSAALAAADDAVLAAIAALNDLSAAQVNAEVDTALADIRLDELLAADSDIDGAAPPAVGSVFHELLSATAGSFTFDQTTDSLEAIRNRGDAAWITAAGFSTLDAAGVRTAVGLAAANLDTQLGDIKADTAAILLDTGTDGVAVGAATQSALADAILARSVSNVEGTAPEHSLCTIVLGILESSVSGTTWTIKRTDGTTTHATKTVATNASAEPITGVS